MFSSYAYFSSFSDTMVAHARDLVQRTVLERQLGSGNLAIEIASNDGYLLQHYVVAGVPVLGVEPAANIAAVAREKGIPTEVAFFGAAYAETLARGGRQADVIHANNVLAHVPDLNYFVSGLETLLAPEGVLTIEVPHLVRLIAGTQFDTIYHEHFSCLSLLTARRILAAHGLELFDVDELASHGGSLRAYAQRRSTGRQPASDRVDAFAAVSATSASTRSRATAASGNGCWPPGGRCWTSSGTAAARAAASPAAALRAKGTRC